MPDVVALLSRMCGGAAALRVSRTFPGELSACGSGDHGHIQHALSITVSVWTTNPCESGVQKRVCLAVTDGRVILKPYAQRAHEGRLLFGIRDGSRMADVVPKSREPQISSGWAELPAAQPGGTGGEREGTGGCTAQGFYALQANSTQSRVVIGLLNC